MGIVSRKELGVRILEAQGRITVGASATELRNSGRLALDAREQAFVVDCSGITLMDSSGLGELVALKQSVDRAGAKLVLAGLTSHVYGLLKTAGVLSSFEAFESLRAAMDYYEGLDDYP
jgi:anti-anti-sigma factor